MTIAATRLRLTPVPALSPQLGTLSGDLGYAKPKTALRPRPELQLLSQDALLLHEERPHLIGAATLALALLVGLFILWAALTPVSEIARAPGEIVPDGYVQLVQSVDGGTVQGIKVHEQQLVAAGETLLQLASPATQHERDEAQAALEALQRRTRTLSAFLKPGAASPPGDNALTSLRAARDSERAVAAQQLAQKRDEIAGLTADLDSFRAQATVADSDYTSLATLRAQGLVTVTRLHEAELRRLTAQGSAARTQAQLAAAQKAALEYQGRITALNAKYTDQASQELAELDGKLAQAQSRVARLDDQLARLTVTAPVAGYVKGLRVNTVGQVTAPGQTLLELVPSDGRLAADLNVKPQDIGFVAVGQPVRLKVSAFDFARYGVFTGHIAALSAATFSESGQEAATAGGIIGGGQAGAKYYRARVEFDTTTVDQAQNQRIAELRPGMTLEGNIVLGEQSVLSYLLKPIHVAATSALSER